MALEYKSKANLRSSSMIASFAFSANSLAIVEAWAERRDSEW